MYQTFLNVTIAVDVDLHFFRIDVLPCFCYDDILFSASDFNPGSCFTHSIPLLIALATIEMNMTIEETIAALTINGAAALGRAEQIGSLEPGKKADIIVLEYPDYHFLNYHFAMNIVEMVFKNGTKVYQKNG
jgi:imidazolonepropionase